MSCSLSRLRVPCPPASSRSIISTAGQMAAARTPAEPVRAAEAAARAAEVPTRGAVTAATPTLRSTQGRPPTRPDRNPTPRRTPDAAPRTWPRIAGPAGTIAPRCHSSIQPRRESSAEAASATSPRRPACRIMLIAPRAQKTAARRRCWTTTPAAAARPNAPARPSCASRRPPARNASPLARRRPRTPAATAA